MLWKGDEDHVFGFGKDRRVHPDGPQGGGPDPGEAGGTAGGQRPDRLQLGVGGDPARRVAAAGSGGAAPLFRGRHPDGRRGHVRLSAARAGRSGAGGPQQPGSAGRTAGTGSLYLHLHPGSAEHPHEHHRGAGFLQPPISSTCSPSSSCWPAWTTGTTWTRGTCKLTCRPARPGTSC